MKTFCCVLLWNAASKKHQAGFKHKAGCSAEVRSLLLVSPILYGMLFRGNLPETGVI